MNPTEKQILQHAAAHAIKCPDADVERRHCGCGKSVAVVCLKCDQPVFFGLEPGPPCEHALVYIRSWPRGSPEYLDAKSRGWVA